ncbi:amino acid ABC transporter permease [Pseudaminobacter sp. NGMCC 1.201702]|uniref:amino acid ABC transporter permease n=1 Tax=Pseudaminobacter sp. NGMCC 1.201702 TaxID=3391825 RepID=UPI0039EE28E9
MTVFQIWLGIFEGFRVTALVTLYGLVFAIPFALVFGIAQFLANGLLRMLVTAIIEFWRSSAVIILLFVFFYALPVFGIELSAMTVSAMVLGLNIGGYASQAVRAGLQAIDRGQVEAGRALGLSRRKILMLVELPQALVAMAPTFMNLLIQLVKGTSLVSLVTLTDMTFRAKEISQLEYNPAGIYTSLLLAYFVVCYPIALIGRWVEVRIGIAGRLPSEL